MDMDQAAAGGLEVSRGGPGMSRAILPAQKQGQLNKHKVHSNLYAWSLNEIARIKLEER